MMMDDDDSLTDLLALDDDSVSSFSLSDLSNITTSSDTDTNECDDESADCCFASSYDDDDDENDENERDDIMNDINSIPNYLNCNFLEDRLKDASIYLKSRVILSNDDDNNNVVGQFEYIYHPDTGQVDMNDYSFARHNGAIQGLMIGYMNSKTKMKEIKHQPQQQQMAKDNDPEFLYWKQLSESLGKSAILTLKYALQYVQDYDPIEITAEKKGDMTKKNGIIRNHNNHSSASIKHDASKKKKSIHYIDTNLPNLKRMSVLVEPTTTTSKGRKKKKSSNQTQVIKLGATATLLAGIVSILNGFSKFDDTHEFLLDDGSNEDDKRKTKYSKNKNNYDDNGDIIDHQIRSKEKATTELLSSKYLIRTAIQLANYIVYCTDTDGSMVGTRDLTSHSIISTTSTYSPGQAVLALVRGYSSGILQQQQQQPATTTTMSNSTNNKNSYLQAALRGALYQIRVRDKHLTTKDLPRDHWLLMSLDELYTYFPKQTFLVHGIRIARSHYFYRQNHDGSYGKSPSVCVVGQHTEGICGSYRMIVKAMIRRQQQHKQYSGVHDTSNNNNSNKICNNNNNSDDDDDGDNKEDAVLNVLQKEKKRLLCSIRSGVGYSLTKQFHPNTFPLPVSEDDGSSKNEKNSIQKSHHHIVNYKGGFPSLRDGLHIRIDYVKHNMFAIWGLIEIMKSEGIIRIKRS